MPKLRFTFYTLSDNNNILPHFILMKDIEYVIIDNIYYNKIDYKTV